MELSRRAFALKATADDILGIARSSFEMEGLLLQLAILLMCDGIQVADMARVFLRQSTSMRQMEAGLHLMTPLTGVVNAIAARFGAGSISEQDLLFCCWMLLEVRTPNSIVFNAFQDCNFQSEMGTPQEAVRKLLLNAKEAPGKLNEIGTIVSKRPGEVDCALIRSLD